MAFWCSTWWWKKWQIYRKPFLCGNNNNNNNNARIYIAPLTPGWQWTSHHHPVNRGTLHLTMMGRECSWLDPSYQRHITFACTGCYQLHPSSSSRHYYPWLIAGTNLPTPKGWIAWLARADCTHITFAQGITQLNPKTPEGNEPGLLGPRLTQ